MKQLIITPDGVFIDNEHHEIPERIAIVLEDGQMLSIYEAAKLLEKAVKVKKESKFSQFRRAFNKAYQETMQEEQ